MMEDKIREVIEYLKRNELLCDTCFLRSGSRWGGAAMTEWACKVCKGQHLAGSTAHESVCKNCAIERGLCQWCGFNKHRYAT